MSQHDYVIANGTGSAVRSDLNNALAAIVSQNSGATTPATTYAFQLWADTTTNTLKLRNSANSAWIELRQLDGDFTTVSVDNGTAAAPSIYFNASGTDTGIYSSGTDALDFSTAGTRRFGIASGGDLTVYSGNVTLNGQGDLRFADSDSSNWVAFQSPATVSANVTWTLPSADGTNGQALTTNGSGTLSWTSPTSTTDKITEGNTEAEVVDTGSDGHFKVTTEGTERMRINSSGNVGIGTTAPATALNLGDTSAESGIQLGDGADFTIKRNVASVGVRFNVGSDLNNYQFQIGGDEALRIDSSKRLLVGTSTSRGAWYNTGSGEDATLQVEGGGGNAVSLTRNVNSASGAYLNFGKSRGTTNGSNTVVQSGDILGTIDFQGADGSEMVEAAFIKAEVDGTPGANDMPGRLVFSTTADGASSPTERMRITQAGEIYAGKTSDSLTTAGVIVSPNADFSYVAITNNTTAGTSSPLYLNRQGSDGTLIEFRQANTNEGTISVSGTTVSYNGAHLSRWSQLPGGAVREEILRGTVLSNIDEMCSWGEEDNEQLNRMKVSDVEGDPNVAGVFQCWDDDDDTYTDDFYCAMTGDFIIRIAEGVTVQRGDLLMSAGDGTAKPQDDGIIRSKTVAKVTSTHVTCTYDDGSYCVPCVLMAC